MRRRNGPRRVVIPTEILTEQGVYGPEFKVWCQRTGYSILDFLVEATRRRRASRGEGNTA